MPAIPEDDFECHASGHNLGGQKHALRKNRGISDAPRNNGRTLRYHGEMVKVSFLSLWIVPLLALAADAPPDSRAADVAVLRGTLKSANRISRIAAVDRTWADVLKTSEPNPKDAFLYEGTINERGEFAISHLLPDRAYDMIVWTTAADGTVTRWEGACMDYHRPIKPATTATAEDRKSIETLVSNVPQFYDHVRPLRIAADHQHATVLVELIRTRDFHSDAGGEVIYRVELWYFENLFGGWAKDANTEKVLARVRGKPADLQKNWQFVPELGGLEAGAVGAAAPLAGGTAPRQTGPATQVGWSFTIPDKLDPRHGIVGGIK